MEVIRDPAAIAAACRRIRAGGRSLGFVPTMGNLHEGHLSLMRRAANECDVAVASIYVNPLQFGANEDLDNYPRTFAADCAGARQAGIDLIFAPDDAAMYPAGFATRVTVTGLTDGLCGRSRPTHFEGVTTVVARLFGLVWPDRAYFGEKDYQQLQVIRRMTFDLGLGIEVIGCPIIREPDGLAMSSRNNYLSAEERQRATVLRRSLDAAVAIGGRPGDPAEPILTAARQVIAGEPLAAIDYVELVDPTTLAPLTALVPGARLCLAVHLGPARLLDNVAVVPAEETA